MAPDVNSLTSSPRNLTQQTPEPTPTSPRRSRPSSLTLPPQARPVHESPGIPVRHSRPLTPAELHLELEQEQEAVVNRLTRELTALRAQTASVASNASSSSNATTSAVLDSTEPLSARTNSLTGPQHPTPSRHHRSSSSLSTRSINSATAAAAVASSSAVPIGSTSQASLDRARDAAGIGARSRGSSTVPQPQGWVLSGAASPSLAVASPSDFSGSAGQQPHGTRQHLPQSVSTARLEEAAKAKEALQEARSENEGLIRKAKELERKLRGLSMQGNDERERGRSGLRGVDQQGSVIGE